MIPGILELKKKKKVRGMAKQWHTQELVWGLVSERLDVCMCVYI